MQAPEQGEAFLRAEPFGKGIDRRDEHSTIERMAVFAPIPTASDRMARSETTGVDLRERTASRKPCTASSGSASEKRFELR
jgi:hypothetical protein